MSRNGWRYMVYAAMVGAALWSAAAYFIISELVRS